MNCYDLSKVDWLGLFNLIAVIVGFYFTSRELRESRKQREQERKSIRLEHSIDCSRNFADLINNELSFIDSCLNNKKYDTAINTFRYEDLKLFDEREYLRLIEGRKEMEKYLHFFSDPDMVDLYFPDIVDAYIQNVELTPTEYSKIRTLIQYEWKLSKEEHEYLKNNKLSKLEDKSSVDKYLSIMQKARDINYYRQKITHYYFEQFTSMMNKLEYFSMTFTTNLADEEVVYPSLHQAFLKIVKYVYPYICHLNSGPSSDKYYTHIIELYNLWKDKYVKDQIVIRKNEEKIGNITVNTNSKF